MRRTALLATSRRHGTPAHRLLVQRWKRSDARLPIIDHDRRQSHYAFWDANQKPAIDTLIKDFNKEYPNIKVTEQSHPVLEVLHQAADAGLVEARCPTCSG